eukprot:g76768.t1
MVEPLSKKLYIRLLFELYVRLLFDCTCLPVLTSVSQFHRIIQDRTNTVKLWPADSGSRSAQEDNDAEQTQEHSNLLT